MRLFQPSFQKLAAMIDHLAHASSVRCMEVDYNPFAYKMGFAPPTSEVSDNDTGSEFDSFNSFPEEELEII